MFDRLAKVALILAALALIKMAWTGLSIDLAIVGPSSSSGGIPLSVSGVGGDGGRFEVATATNGVGTVFVTRIDRWTGAVEVFALDADGRLVPVDKR